MEATIALEPPFDDLLTIADIARTLNAFRPLDETMQLICERVAGMPACDSVTISLVSEEGTSTRSWGDRHIKPEFMAWARSQNHVEKSLKSPVFHAIASGRPVLIADVLERPDLTALRAGASVQGIRAMAYVPIMARGKALGTMNCYANTPHRHTDAEVDLLQTVARLAGAAAETALIAEKQRSASEGLRRTAAELSTRNAELANLSEAQVRLTEGMTEVFGSSVQHVVDGLAAEIGAAVMVVSRDGRPHAFSGPEESRDVMTATLRGRDLAKLATDRPSWTLGDCTVIRIGASRTVGLLLVYPDSARGSQSSLVLLRHTAAILAFEFEAENSDRALRDLARPNALLAVAHGRLSPVQAKAMAPVLLATGVVIRVLMLEVANDVTASRLADALNRGPQAWGYLVSAAEGSHVVALLLDRPLASIEKRLEGLMHDMKISSWRGGLSSTFRNVTDVPDAVECAVSAMRAAAPAGRLVAFEDLGPTARLLDAIGRDRAREFVAETLGPIMEYDASHSTDLVKSLTSYLACRRSLRRASAELNVHPNTLQLRLARIAQLTMVDLQDPEQLGLMALALAWRRFV